MRVIKSVILFFIIPSFVLALILRLAGIESVSFRELTDYIRRFLGSQMVNSISVPFIPDVIPISDVGAFGWVIDAINFGVSILNVFVSIFNSLLTAIKILFGFFMFFINASGIVPVVS